MSNINTQPFPKQALVFTCLQHESFENTAGKEKLLVTSNFSFTRSVFYPFGELSAIFIEFKIVVCKLSFPLPTVFSTRFENFLPFSSNLKLLSVDCFTLEEFKIYCLGKG